MELVVVLVGLFAIGETIYVASRYAGRRDPASTRWPAALWMTREDWRRSWKPWLRGTALGFPIGALPAGGSEIPTFLSYMIERRLSPRREEFGREGAIEGVAGPEAANNAAAAGVLVPLLTLGLPTSATAAILLAAFQNYGLQPGPFLFLNNPDLVWGLIASLYVGNVMLLVLNLPLVGLWVRLLLIPRPWLYGGIMVFGIVGVYGLGDLRARPRPAWSSWGSSATPCGSTIFRSRPALLGMILGPMAETQLRRALAIGQGIPVDARRVAALRDAPAPGGRRAAAPHPSPAPPPGLRTEPAVDRGLLLDGVRAPRGVPSYSGGLGVLAGDFLKGAHDLALPVVGRRAPLGRGLHDAAARRRGRARGRVARASARTSWTTPAFASGSAWPGAASSAACGAWAATRSCPSTSWSRPTRGTSGSRAGSTIPAPTAGSPRRCCWGSAGRGRSGSSAPGSPHLPLQRGARRVRGHGADRGADGARASFEAAWRAARSRVVFTTHTPVPAGNEIHSLADILRLGAGCELVAAELRQLGGDPFNMTVAGLRLARRANAVSELHGQTARAMWADVRGAAPIIAITNGVHVPTWQDPAMPAALESDARSRPSAASSRASSWPRSSGAPACGSPPTSSSLAVARRAATYKRPDLVLRDVERVGRLLKGRQLQLVFAGKAHPADRAGKAMVTRMRPDDPPVAGRRRLPGELRHGAGPAPHARGRRVAQHAAPPARGERHLGDEGRAERHAPLLDPGRLVARGMRARRDGLGDRRRGGRRAVGGPRRARSRLALPDHRGARCCPPTRIGPAGSP